jgi:hypothetical protein
MRFAQLLQRFQTVHHWHFDVERKNIGIDLLDFLQRDAPICGGARNFNIRLAGEDVTDHPANHHRIVHDKNPDLWHRDTDHRLKIETASQAREAGSRYVHRPVQRLRLLER